MKNNNVIIEVISSHFGKCIAINNYRIAGQKPFGVGEVECQLKTNEEEIYKALNNQKEFPKSVIRFENYKHEWG